MQQRQPPQRQPSQRQPPQHQPQEHHPQQRQLSYITVERKDIHPLEVLLAAAVQGMKFSYEINGYKKVSGDYFYIIPRGRKHVVWFTMYKTKPTAIFYELDPRDHTKIKFISIREPHPRCFRVNPELCAAGENGTVCYGTLFLHKSHQFFSIENIHVYKGRNVDTMSVRDKSALIAEMFSDGLGEDGGSGCGGGGDESGDPITRVWFGVPVKRTTYVDALRAASSDVTYPVYAIQGRFEKQTDNKYFQNSQNHITPATPTIPTPTIPITTASVVSVQSVQQPPIRQQRQGQRVFIACAESQADLYLLRCPESGQTEPEYAHIGDYKTSVFMNSIFRNVRENVRLDAAEESEDESEFQHTGETNSDDSVKGFVIKKEVRVLCAFNYRFKRWIPLKRA
jgi:hypothetical protein